MTAASDSNFPEPLGAADLDRAWDRAWGGLGFPVPLRLRRQLTEAWSEPHRHYHDRRHLGECLALAARWQCLFDRSAEVEIALWFHDAVYVPQSESNELESAAWAARSLLAAGTETDIAQRVYDLVRATRHSASPPGRVGAAGEGGDCGLLLDIDLAVLGSPPERFADFEAGVRKVHVSARRPLPARAGGRASELSRSAPDLLQRRRAFNLLERQARANLADALETLRQ